jgi:hypothetical protein
MSMTQAVSNTSQTLDTGGGCCGVVKLAVFVPAGGSTLIQQGLIGLGVDCLLR